MVRQYTANGKQVPKRAEPPELEPGLELYLHGFFDLDTERQIGYGIGPIPHSKIIEYCYFYDIDDVYYFMSVIRELDGWKLKTFKEELDGKEKLKTSKGRS